jgi:hypothetical protein
VSGKSRLSLRSAELSGVKVGLGIVVTGEFVKIVEKCRCGRRESAIVFWSTKGGRKSSDNVGRGVQAGNTDCGQSAGVLGTPHGEEQMGIGRDQVRI